MTAFNDEDLDQLSQEYLQVLFSDLVMNDKFAKELKENYSFDRLLNSVAEVREVTSLMAGGTEAGEEVLAAIREHVKAINDHEQSSLARLMQLCHEIAVMGYPHIALVSMFVVGVQFGIYPDQTPEEVKEANRRYAIKKAKKEKAAKKGPKVVQEVNKKPL